MILGGLAEIRECSRAFYTRTTTTQKRPSTPGWGSWSAKNAYCVIKRRTARVISKSRTGRRTKESINPAKVSIQRLIRWTLARIREDSRRIPGAFEKSRLGPRTKEGTKERIKEITCPPEANDLK